MKAIDPTKVPPELTAIPNWVLWRMAERGGKLTKVPFTPLDRLAEADNAATWCRFEDVVERFNQGGYLGIGFEFGTEPSGFVGIDLDGCRDPQTGKVAEWAKEIILRMDSYAEVSPSESGVKIFLRGTSPFDSGKNLKLPLFGATGGKSAGIEIYDHRRYFAVTGWRVKGPATCNERQNELDWLKGKFWPDAAPFKGGDFYGDDSVLERARKYLIKCPPAISGQNGSGAAFHVACILVMGFGLSRETAMVLFREWSQTCQPPWSERELAHKIDDAAKQPGQRNFLRNVTPQRWDSISVPNYASLAAPEKTSINTTTIADAAKKYLDFLESGGGQQFIDMGFPDLDFALAGGVEAGEMIIVAARPSHGKSMLALQFIHHWADNCIPCLMVSEEMSELAIGKRVLQFATDVPQEHWFDRIDTVRRQMTAFSQARAKCRIVENCRSVGAVIEQIDRAVEEDKIGAAVIDYAQLLGGKGKDRYEIVTNTSVALRQAANKHKILMVVLCQLSREIEKRNHFVPVMSDLKESGQLEQDADVILFLVWPWKLDSTQPPKQFRVHVAKNRNRPINANIVQCEFNPARQIIKGAAPENRERAFDDYAQTEEKEF